MKKTVSIIFRLAFLVFGIWAILENVSFNILSVIPSLSNFTVFSNTLCIITIGIVFFVSLKKTPGAWLTHIKGVCTLLAWLIFLLNSSILIHGISTDWILKIFLPIMMILDWLFFDSKGRLKLSDLLLWLAGLIALVTGFIYLLSKLFGMDDFLNMAGLGSHLSTLLNLLPYLLGIGFLMYLLDNLFSKKGKKNSRELLKMIFRLCFIILEIFSFYILSGAQLPTFLASLRHYPALINFLCLLCITVLVIYQFFGSGKRSEEGFPRLKALFTISILALLLIVIFIIKTHRGLGIVDTIHFIIAPIMMLLDLILFDYKKSYRGFDPIVWISIPVLYSILNIAFRFSDISYYSVVTLFGGFGILILIGYLFFFIGKIK